MSRLRVLGQAGTGAQMQPEWIASCAPVAGVVGGCRACDIGSEAAALSKRC